MVSLQSEVVRLEFESLDCPTFAPTFAPLLPNPDRELGQIVRNAILGTERGGAPGPRVRPWQSAPSPFGLETYDRQVGLPTRTGANQPSPRPRCEVIGLLHGLSVGVFLGAYDPTERSSEAARSPRVACPPSFRFPSSYSLVLPRHYRLANGPHHVPAVRLGNT